MPITYRPAVRSGVKLMIGVAGCSGSGKTMSALEVATGIQEVEGGEIFVVDTESRRAAHYAGDGTRGTYRFQHGDLTAPFSPESYLEAIEVAVGQGAKVVVIDSMSHEHEGPGGILEMHEANVNRMAGENASYGRREAVKFSAWIEPKRRHNAFVNRLLQVDAHFVFCFRAKDKLAMVPVQKNGRTVNEPVSIGWQPIAADRLEYEMTTLFVLPPGAKGRPDLEAQATKLPEPLRPLVKEGAQISRGFGRALAEWARGDAAKQNATRGPSQAQSQREPLVQTDGAQAEGSRLSRYHRTLSGAPDRDELAARHDGFREEFAEADADERASAGALFKLHQRRVNGLPKDEFDEQATAILGEAA